MNGYGIEIEAEGIHSPFSVLAGRHEGDGSLRSGGVEYISDILQGSNTAKAWHSAVINKLRKHGARFSHRCGVHIHTDVRNYGHNELKTFIRNYLVVERTIFRIVGHNRDKNTFCMPLQEFDGDLHSLTRFFRTSNRSYLMDLSKYSALNLKPIETQGSIEFRMLPTVQDIDIFNQVIDIIEELHTLSDVSELVKKYNIPSEEVNEALAFYELLNVRPSRNKEMKFLDKHFDVPTPKSSSRLTEELLQEYLQSI